MTKKKGKKLNLIKRRIAKKKKTVLEVQKKRRLEGKQCLIPGPIDL